MTAEEEAAHAMQSGVAFDQGNGSQDGSPKHLRVGVNACHVDHAALVRLLIARNLFTEKEYREAIRKEMILEVESYEKYLSEKFKKEITLG